MNHDVRCSQRTQHRLFRARSAGDLLAQAGTSCPIAPRALLSGNERTTHASAVGSAGCSSLTPERRDRSPRRSAPNARHAVALSDIGTERESSRVYRYLLAHAAVVRADREAVRLCFDLLRMNARCCTALDVIEAEPPSRAMARRTIFARGSNIRVATRPPFDERRSSTAEALRRCAPGRRISPAGSAPRESAPQHQRLENQRRKIRARPR